MNTQGFFYNAVAALLRIALVVTLIAAVWNIYRHLPGDSHEQSESNANVVPETSLQIILREPLDEPRVPLNMSVDLNPIDIMAAQREYASEHRPGKRWEDFLAERMGSRSKIATRFDESGQVTVKVRSGPWWIHTTLLGELNTEWRLRVNVSGQKQTVELTLNNAYMRSMSF